MMDKYVLKFLLLLDLIITPTLCLFLYYNGDNYNTLGVMIYTTVTILSFSYIYNKQYIVEEGYGVMYITLSLWVIFYFTDYDPWMIILFIPKILSHINVITCIIE